MDGPQEKGKSTLFNRLAGDAWFNDGLTLTDMQDKTGAEKLQGYWIMEIGELTGMRKSDIDSVKSFISRRDDKYRKISDITISMRAVDHLKMPEYVITEVKVKLSDEEREVYDRFKRELVVSLKGEELDAGNAAVLAGKLSQMANGAVYGENKRVLPIHERKLDAFLNALKYHRLTSQQRKTLRGQALAGNLMAAQAGLRKIVSKGAPHGHSNTTGR